MLRAAACALAALWLCTAFNLRGLRTASGVQAVTTVLKAVPLLLVGVLGLASLQRANFVPFNPSGLPLLDVTAATTALTLWALLGLECATVPAEASQSFLLRSEAASFCDDSASARAASSEPSGGSSRK